MKPRLLRRFRTQIKFSFMDSGFTLIELLVVIAIIGVLSGVILSAVNKARDSAYRTRAREELNVLAKALELYAIDNGSYPPDVSRDIPPGIGQYLAGYTSSTWPQAPWPGSVYDWDNWIDPVTGEGIFQISIRFCPLGGGLSTCQFPHESWAANFGVDSAYYYCVAGACRSHLSQPINYPGYCVNC